MADAGGDGGGDGSVQSVCDDVMAGKPLQIGPWPLGVDNVHRPDHRVFQVPGQGEPPARLTAAVDVDLTDEGWPRSRQGLTTVQEIPVGPSVVSFAGNIIFQSKNSICVLGGGVIVEGLDKEARVEFQKHGGQLFWTNGQVCGRITQSLDVLNWGLEICPTPTIRAHKGGNLTAGEYLVAAEYIDSSGIIHAADTAASVTLETNGKIIVDFESFSEDAVYIRVYLAGPNDNQLFLWRDVPVEEFPLKINSLPQEDTECWTIGLAPPEPCDFLFDYQDRMMLVDGQWIYPSVGAAVHLYDLGTTAIQRPEDILAAGGLPEGFWTVSKRGAYWCSGDLIEQWRTIDLKHTVEFCAGALQVNTSALPWLGIEPQPAVLFWSRWGLAVGLSGGSMLFPMRDRYNMDVADKRASFVFRESDDLKQLIVVVV